jgi:hypothetical protein
VAAPFVNVEDFADSFRPLKPSEQQLAEWLLEVASDWIRDKKPTISNDSVAAKLVVTEVVSNALRYNKYSPFSTFNEQTSHSSMSGTFSHESAGLDFTDRHRDMLGISVQSPPKYSFPAYDY